jgi:hypothetical protein
MLCIINPSDCEIVADAVVDFWRSNQELMNLASSNELTSQQALDCIKRLLNSDLPLVKSFLTNRSKSLSDLEASIEYLKEHHKLAIDQLGENKYRNLHHGLLLIQLVVAHELFDSNHEA